MDKDDEGFDLVAWIRAEYPQLADHLDRDVGFKRPDEPYFPPSSDWLAFQTSGKVVRLDVAIFAVHLASARILYRPMAHLVYQRVVKVGEFLGEGRLKSLSKTVLKLVGVVVVKIVIGLYEVFKREAREREMEAAIRRACNKVQYDLNGRFLATGKRKRHRKTVSSRHKTAPQRRFHLR